MSGQQISNQTAPHDNMSSVCQSWIWLTGKERCGYRLQNFVSKRAITAWCTISLMLETVWRNQAKHTGSKQTTTSNNRKTQEQGLVSVHLRQFAELLLQKLQNKFGSASQFQSRNWSVLLGYSLLSCVFGRKPTASLQQTPVSKQTAALSCLGNPSTFGVA